VFVEDLAFDVIHTAMLPVLHSKTGRAKLIFNSTVVNILPGSVTPETDS